MKNSQVDFIDMFLGRIKFINDRIEVLEKEKRFYEIVFWKSFIVEAELALLISTYEEALLYATRGNALISFKKREPEDLIVREKKTLGRLRDDLMKYCNDSVLFKSLDEFIKVRNLIIHRFFFLSFGDPGYAESLIFRKKPIKFLINSDHLETVLLRKIVALRRSLRKK